MSLLETMTRHDSSIFDKEVMLEGCDCTNSWIGGIYPNGDSAILLAELGTPERTTKVTFDPRVEELRKRGILPP
jgi:hypothetical protein